MYFKISFIYSYHLAFFTTYVNKNITAFVYKNINNYNENILRFYTDITSTSNQNENKINTLHGNR